MDEAGLYSKFVEILLGCDFDRKYYAYCERHREGGWKLAAWLEPAKEALAPHLEFKYQKKEQFFQCREAFVGGEFKLHLSLKPPTAEWGLYVRVGEEAVGGPFTVLARTVGKRRDPGFSPDPPAPRPRLSNPEQMKLVVTEGLALFEDVKKAVVAYDWKALAEASGGMT